VDDVGLVLSYFEVFVIIRRALFSVFLSNDIYNLCMYLRIFADVRVKLMAGIRSHDLDIELQEPIEEKRLSVEMPIDRPRHWLSAVIEQSEPRERSKNASLHSERPEIPGRFKHADDRHRAEAGKSFWVPPILG
jgi:hypothetical protein